jgi:hypothetical protein
MNTQSATDRLAVAGFEKLNWAGDSPLPRDQAQSHRLHEPDHLINTIDPITGHDITDVTRHPHLEDGNLTIYFESEQTMREFLNTPVNHPYAQALGELPADAERGG